MTKKERGSFKEEEEVEPEKVEQAEVEQAEDIESV